MPDYENVLTDQELRLKGRFERGLVLRPSLSQTPVAPDSNPARATSVAALSSNQNRLNTARNRQTSPIDNLPSAGHDVGIVNVSENQFSLTRAAYKTTGAK